MLTRRSVLLSAASIIASPAAALDWPRHMKPGQIVSAPIGWAIYIRANPDPVRAPSGPVAMSDRVMRDLATVNTKVNSSGLGDGASVTDWMVGGCTRAVLMKRKALIEMGYNPSILRPAMAITEQSRTTDHLALIVLTAEGDYALDINAKAPTLFSWLPYKWVSRLGNAGQWETV